MKVEATCERCGKVFKYKKIKARWICPKCKKEVLKEARARYWHKQRKLPTEEHGTALDAAGVSKLTREEVASILKVSGRVVRRAERTALAKLRSNPELMKQWLLYKDEGCPTPGAPEEIDVGAELLERVFELSDFCNLQDTMYGAGCPQEALECRAEIERCHRAVAKALADLRGEEWPAAVIEEPSERDRILAELPLWRQMEKHYA
jgi:predicted RNA-binding Zn-ribbon protein involved in translation (DUF1610 family)